MKSILFVDDEENIIRALTRLFMNKGWEVLTASDAAAALALMKGRQVSVVVSDNQMPGMGGIEFLSRVKVLHPDTVRVMMTAFADISTALDAINRCEAYRFVVKPWDNDHLVQVVCECMDRHELLTALKRPDEALYRSLAHAIDLKDHYTRGHCDRVAELSGRLAPRLGFDSGRLEQLRNGALMHDCGKIGVPEAVLNFPGRGPSEEDMELIRSHPAWGAEVARQANMPDVAVNIILHHHEWYDGRGYPGGLAGEEIPLEARIVAVADVHDALRSDRRNRKAMPPDVADREFRKMIGATLDPKVAEEFLRMLEEGPAAGN